VECKLRCVNFRGVSDPRRAFMLAFRVTEICDDCYRCTMGVSLIGLETPWSARENFGCTWEHLGGLETSVEVPTTNQRAPGSARDKPGSAGAKSGSTGGRSWSTSNHSSAVREKQHLPWQCCICT